MGRTPDNKNKSTQKARADGTRYAGRAPLDARTDRPRGAPGERRQSPAPRSGNAAQNPRQRPEPRSGNAAQNPRQRAEPRSGNPAQNSRQRVESRSGNPAHSPRTRPESRERRGVYAETGGQSAARRRAKSRRTAGRIYAAAAIVIAGAAAVLALTVFFKVEKIEVRGSLRYSPEEIAALTGIHHGDNLFLMDKPAIAQKLEKELIYVEKAVIRRHLPNRLVITITEITVAGAFPAEEGFWLSDSAGTLIEPAAEKPPNVPLIKGAELEEPAPGKAFKTKDAARQQPLLELFAAMKEKGVTAKVGEIDITRVYDTVIVYDGDFEVSLGRSGGFAQSFDRLFAVLAELERKGIGAAKIDLADGGAYVVELP